MSNEKATVRELRAAVQTARLEQAQRDDAVAELQEEERVRLSMLEEELQGVVDDLPESQRDIALALLPGDPPRYWVDATSHVAMARDKRTYRFVKDTKIGRTLLHEGTDVGAVADAVTRYVAERIVERQRAVEENWALAHNRQVRISRSADPGQRDRSILYGFVLFGFGMLAGAALLLTYAWFMIG